MLRKLTSEQLEELTTYRLVALLRSITAEISYYDNSYRLLYDDYDPFPEQYLIDLKDYKQHIKNILKNREHLAKKPKRK